MQPHMKDVIKIKIKMDKKWPDEKVTPLVNRLALRKRDLICIKPKTYREEGEKKQRGSKPPTVASEAIGLQPLCRPEGVEGRVTETECIAASPREVKDGIRVEYIMCANTKLRTNLRKKKKISQCVFSSRHEQPHRCLFPLHLHICTT